jgi:hypothetical protein
VAFFGFFLLPGFFISGNREQQDADQLRFGLITQEEGVGTKSR